MSSLLSWAERRGIDVAGGVELTSLPGGGRVVRMTRSAPAGTPVLVVPRSLSLASSYAPDLLEPSDGSSSSVNEALREAVDSSLAESGLEEYEPEFRLVVRVLSEVALGDESPRVEYLRCLPETFDTGIYMTDDERAILPPVAFALAEFQDRQLKAFELGVRIIADVDPRLGESLSREDDGGDRLIRWAFSVVFSRSWRTPSSGDDGSGGGAEEEEASIVPFADMFNHRDPANVVVSYDDDSIAVILKEDVELEEGRDAATELCLNYGQNDPSRLLVIFGFVDPTTPEIYSNVNFPDPDDDLIRLGAGDRTKMVYRTRDGAIANSVWDCVLYATLGSRPEERKRLVDAVVNGDAEIRKALHDKYALETSLALKNHVEQTLLESYPLQSIPQGGKETTRTALIRQHNNFVRGVFEKVKARLEGMVESETKRRLAERAARAASQP